MNTVTDTAGRSSLDLSKSGQAALDAMQQIRQTRLEMREAAVAGQPALERLAKVMRQKTGQSYKLRALLYSLWNGQPASLLDVVDLDWALKRDLCTVVLAFGFESATAPELAFFYDAISDAMKREGLLAWFLEAGQGVAA